MHKNFMSLCQNNLSNKNRRTTKCKKASFKKFGNFPGSEKSISRIDYGIFEFKMKKIRSYKMAHLEITNKTMIKIVMLMRDLVLGSRFVVAFFFRKLL